MTDDRTREVLLAELETFKPGEAWLTIVQAAVALGLDERQVSGDLGLLAAARVHPIGELMLDAADVVRHAHERRRPLAEDQASQRAEALLAELHDQGLDTGLLGGDAA